MKKLNIAQRTSRERALEEEADQLREQLTVLQAELDVLTFVLDSIPDYASYVNADLTYQVCNQKYETETGKNRDAFLGKHVVEFIGERGLAKIQ